MANKKEKSIVLKASFDLKNINLRFLEFDYDYDDTLHDLSNQFKRLSFVLSPSDECKGLFLMNLSEMYSKAGKNVLFLSNDAIRDDAIHLTGMLIENGKKNGDLLVFDKNIGKKYFSTNLPNGYDLINYLEEKINSIKGLDYIIIDNIDLYRQENYEGNTEIIKNLVKLSEEKNICIIAGSDTNPAKLEGNEIRINDFSYTRIKIFASSFVLGLRRFTPNVLERVFKKDYNIVLKILKNVEGEIDLKFLAKIETDKLKLRILKNFSS
jgi:hypothetical protein